LPGFDEAENEAHAAEKWANQASPYVHPGFKATFLFLDNYT
jgi:hypothetical protein